MKRLDRKVAIITGASSGIGRAAALVFAQQGARVVVGARRAAKLEALVDEIESAGGVASALPGDVGDPHYAKALVDHAKSRHGGLDIAFNNSGTLGPMGPIEALNRDAVHMTLRVNLESAFWMAQHQVAAMRERGGGSIIFTSTFVGYTAGFPGMSAYAASKAGLIGLTQTLAAECGAANIRVNALLPGGTDTPMGRVVANSPEALAHIQSLHALGRLADPAEIASAALFLASNDSGFATGTAMLIDGGVSIHR